MHTVADTMNDASEMGFLCLVCGPPSDESERQIGVRLDSGVDWTAAVQNALDNGLLPLFCARLLESFAD